MSTTTGRVNRTVTLRCITTDGDEISRIDIDTNSSFAASALNAVIGDRPSGTISAGRFARSTFAAMGDYEAKPDLRARVTLRHLQALDGLALAAVTRDIPATITWS